LAYKTVLDKERREQMPKGTGYGSKKKPMKKKKGKK